MKVCIIGVAGLVGAALEQHCLDLGHDVVGTHHRRPPSGRAESRSLDVRDADAIAKVVAAVNPDAIINAAYVAGGEQLEAVTERAPGLIAAAARRSDAHMVHISTDVVFAGNPDRPYTETDLPDPVHEYGRAKHRAEGDVMRVHADATVVRTSLLYGGLEPHAQEALVRRAVDQGDIAFYTDEVRCPTTVPDLARALVALVGAPGIWHVAGADAMDRLSFARLLAPTLGVDPAALRGGRLDRNAAPRPAHVELDCAKAGAIGIVAAGAYEVLSG